MNKELSHIVLLTPGFAVNEDDSITIPALQVYLKSLKKTLPATKITIIAFQFPYTKEPYKWNGIDVIPLNGRNQHLKKMLIWQRALSKLKKIHLQDPITVIHSLWIGECSFIGNKFAVQHSIPHIVTVMGQDAKKNRYTRLLFDLKIKVVTLSPNHQKTLYEKYKVNSTVIPWSIDISSFPELMKSEIDILGVGWLNDVKNFKEFVEIVFLLVKDFPKLKVEIVGDGKLYDELLFQIKQRKLESVIRLCGLLPREEVLKKMTRSHILLHTSTYESYGYVFTEALYSGMYIVSRNIGVASKIDSWKICANQKEMISNCTKLLSQSNRNKQRVLLNSEKETVASYLKLYNA